MVFLRDGEIENGMQGYEELLTFYCLTSNKMPMGFVPFGKAPLPLYEVEGSKPLMGI